MITTSKTPRSKSPYSLKVRLRTRHKTLDAHMYSKFKLSPSQEYSLNNKLLSIYYSLMWPWRKCTTTLLGTVSSASDSWSVDACQSSFRAPSKATVVSLSKKLYPHCLVLVGSRNGFEGDLHMQKMLVSQSN